MKKEKPYIEVVLDAIFYFAQKQDTVKKSDLIEWVTPKIKNAQMNAAINNYANDHFKILKSCGPSEWKIDKKALQATYDRYLNGDSRLWYNLKRSRYKPLKKSVPYKVGHIVCAIFAAYDRPMSASEIEELSKKHNIDVGYRSIFFTITRAKVRHGVKVGKKDRSIIYGPSVEAIMDIGPEKLKQIIPNKSAEIEAWFLKHSKNTEKQPASEAVKIENENNKPIESEQVLIEPEIVDADADSEKQDFETIDAVNVGHAIISYIRKLQVEKKQAASRDFAKLRYDAEQQSQTIINLRNQAVSYESKIKKLEKVIDDQNKRIVNLSSELIKSNNKIQSLFLELSKPTPSTFKVSEVARMTKLIKNG